MDRQWSIFLLMKGMMGLHKGSECKGRHFFDSQSCLFIVALRNKTERSISGSIDGLGPAAWRQVYQTRGMALCSMRLST